MKKKILHIFSWKLLLNFGKTFLAISMNSASATARLMYNDFASLITTSGLRPTLLEVLFNCLYYICILEEWRCNLAWILTENGLVSIKLNTMPANFNNTRPFLFVNNIRNLQGLGSLCNCRHARNQDICYKYYISTRYHPRFLVQVGHETTYVSIGNKHFFTK